jgi:hypothetical protein
MTPSMLSGMQQLTQLELDSAVRLEFAALEHMPHLQHLSVWIGDLDSGGGKMEALAQLTALQELTLLISTASTGSLQSVLKLTQLQRLRSLTVTKGNQDRLRVSGFGDRCWSVMPSVLPPMLPTSPVTASSLYGLRSAQLLKNM